MENASKALIIAGAILISILLISVGIIIMNAVNNPADQVAKVGDSATIQSFNSAFAKYEGTKKGATLSNLSQEVRISNNQNPDKQISLTLPSSVTSSATLSKTTNYTVALDYDDEGYVKSIVVSALGKADKGE